MRSSSLSFAVSLDTGGRDAVAVSSCATCRQPQFTYVTVLSRTRWTPRTLRQWKCIFLYVLFLWPLTFKIFWTIHLHIIFMFIIFLLHVCYGTMQWPWRSEEGNWFLGIGVTDGREVPDRCWECNLGPLESSRVPSTAEPSFQLLTNSNTLAEVI